MGIRSRATQAGRQLAVHKMYKIFWDEFNPRQIRGRARYRESSFRGTKGISSPYRKVGGCALASASEWTAIAIPPAISAATSVPPASSAYTWEISKSKSNFRCGCLMKKNKMFVFLICVRFEIWNFNFFQKVIPYRLLKRRRHKTMQSRLCSLAQPQPPTSSPSQLCKPFQDLPDAKPQRVASCS